MPETLDFEEPVAILLKEIEALGCCRDRRRATREIARLRRRVESIRARDLRQR